jgi:mannosyltransferase
MNLKGSNHIAIYLDNIVFGIQKFGGASTYWMELLKRFTIEPNVFMITQGDNRDICDLNNNILNYQTAPTKFIKETCFSTSILRYIPLTKRLPVMSVYHNSYYRTSLQKSIVNIFTVHDFTHKKGYASKFPRNLIHINLTAIGLKNSDGIICISENTKNDMLHYYPQLSKKNIKVIYHGVNEDYFPLSKSGALFFNDSFDLNKPYIVFIGKRGGYKNFQIIPESIRELQDIRLVIVGGEQLSAKDIEQLNAILPGRYVRFEGLTNNEINVLYNYAIALVYPSIYEGFGFPVVEAMRAGCPVISTKLSSIPEVAGNAALYLEDLTPQSITACITLLRESQIRDSCIKKGFNQSKKFSWEKCAQETFQFYIDTYNKKYGV